MADKDNFLGKDSILSFVNFIEGLPSSESSMPSIIFYPGLLGKDLSIIGKMSGENCSYKFQDGSFFDTKWNPSGTATEVKWTLNFSSTSNKDENQKKLITLNLLLKATLDDSSSYYFKIKSLKR